MTIYAREFTLRDATKRKIRIKEGTILQDKLKIKESRMEG